MAQKRDKPRSSIEEEWQVYAAYVMPRNASEVQVRRERQAFYAGCVTFNYIVGHCHSLDEKEGRKLWERYQDELQAYNDMMLGKALKESTPGEQH